MLCNKFFKGIESCYKVLRRLYKDGYLKRMKLVNGCQNSEYVYYIKRPPAQLKHCLKRTEFLCAMCKRYKTESYEIEKQYGNIKPDATIFYNSNKAAFIEVELSNKGFDYLKYENFYASGEWKKYFEAMPDILIYSKQVPKISDTARCKYMAFEMTD